MGANAALALFIMFPICTIVLMVWVQFMVEGVVMSAAQDLVNEIAAQLSKAKDEIVGEINKLTAAASAGESVDLSALQGLAQGLDDIVPDAVDEVLVSEVEAVEG